VKQVHRKPQNASKRSTSLKRALLSPVQFLLSKRQGGVNSGEFVFASSQQKTQPWRTEPEIDGQRQQWLADRLKIIPDIQQGSYPFQGATLSRADVEWLICMHEHKQIQLDSSQQKRKGIDLRGADLRGVNLQQLPLAHMYGGLTPEEQWNLTDELREAAAVHLEKANLVGTHLEHAILGNAHLEATQLSAAFLQHVDLSDAHLE
jgi:uncharacterized protein YjbI with pentapeptide repeats